MSDDPRPDQTLPEDLDDDVEDNELDDDDESYPGEPITTDPQPNQDLPSDKQPPRGPGNNRGRSDQAPGKTKR